jgi:hypothetical protein
MIKQMTQFKAVVNELENIFHFDSSASTAIAKEACLLCLKWLGQVEDADKAKKEAEAMQKVEEVKDDESAA